MALIFYHLYRLVFFFFFFFEGTVTSSGVKLSNNISTGGPDPLLCEEDIDRSEFLRDKYSEGVSNPSSLPTVPLNPKL